MLDNLAIIPARGGSKRIPQKNIKAFLGKPIIAYSIEAALKSKLFNEVMVSTDDPKIAKVATKYGAKVPFLRSPENADDYATLADVVDEVKKGYLALNMKFNRICCILPTAPLITLEHLKTAYEILENQNIDSVRPIGRFTYPIQRAVKSDKGRLSLFYPEYQNSRSQDLEPAYHDAGQFYWMKWKSGLRGINKYGYEIPQTYVQDIDSLEDWSLAEIKYKIINQ